MRAKRFRHQLLDSTFIQSEDFSKLEDALQHFHLEWTAEKMSDAEWTTIYLLVFGLFHRPQDFLGGPNGEKLEVGNARYSTDQFLSYFEKENPKWARHFPRGESLIQFVCNRSLRSIPLAVNSTLAAWSRGDYPLDLREDVPTVDEVLEMQVLGRRCVSVLMKPTELRSFIEGRDALSFAIHDLLHADHFFRDADQMKAQIEFFRRLKGCAEHRFIQTTMKSDPQFCFDWEYLVADMNTVPLHMFKTFKAFLLKAVKRAHDTDLTKPLSEEHEKHFANLILEVGSIFRFTEAEQTAWMNLNTPEFIFPEQAMHLTEAVQSISSASISHKPTPNKNGHPSREERVAVVEAN